MGGCFSAPKNAQKDQIKKLQTIPNNINNSKLSEVHPEKIKSPPQETDNTLKNEITPLINAEMKKDEFTELISRYKNLNEKIAQTDSFWKENEILTNKKCPKYEIFKVFNKEQQKFYLLNCYSFAEIGNINQERKSEIVIRCKYFEDIQNKYSSTNFICKFCGVIIQEKCLIMVHEFGELGLRISLTKKKDITLEELNSFVLKFLDLLIQLEKLNSENPLPNNSLHEISILQGNLKIKLDICEGETKDQSFSRFFSKVEEIIRKNSEIGKHKSFEKFQEAIIAATSKNISKYEEIFQKFEELKISPPKPKSPSKTPTMAETVNHTNPKTDEEKIETYLNSANFFNSIGNQEELQKYTAKALEILQKNNSNSSNNQESECLEVIIENSLLNNTTLPQNFADSPFLIKATEKNIHHSAETAVSMNNLALDYKYTGQNKLAEETLLKSLEILHNSKGVENREKDEEEATILNNLGGVYYNQFNLSKAKEYYEKALGVREKKKTALDENFGKNFNNLGLIYKKTNNSKKALEFYNRSLEILSNFPNNNTYTASVFNNLGGLHHGLRQYDKARENYQKSFTLRTNNSSSNPLELAQSLNNLGTLFKDMGNLEKGRIYLEKGAEIYKKYEIRNSCDKAICFNNLALAYFEAGSKQKAKEFYLLANEIWRQMFGEKNEIFLSNLQKIREIK